MLFACLQACNPAKKLPGNNDGADALIKNNYDYYVLIVRQKVLDYGSWKMAYDAGNGQRLAAGMHNYSISRSPEDTNVVQVALRINDTLKASPFFNGDGTKKMWLKTVEEDASTDTTQLRVMITHKVKDRTKWKMEFSSNKDARLTMGLKDRAIDFHINDVHTVTVVSAVIDLQKARSYLNSNQYKNHLKVIGVKGKPDIFFYKVVQKY